MSQPAALFEDDFRQLRKLLELDSGLMLVFVFANPSNFLNVTFQRLADSFAFRAAKLERLAFDDSITLSNTLFSEIIHESQPDSVLKIGVWVDMNSLQKEWGAARKEILSRLNERRHLLETRFRRPLILVLPLGNEWTVAAAAPDLWSMRATVITVPDGASLLASGSDPVRHQGVIPLSIGRNVPSAELPPEVTRAIQEWKRNALLPSPGRSALLSGEFAFDLVKPFDEVAATDIANQLLLFCRNQLRAPSVANRESLRDVSVSLNRVGDMAKARGDLEGAKAAYVESLEVSRRVASVFGENRESLDDLALSLIRVSGPLNLKEAKLIWGRLGAIDHNDEKWRARLAFVNSAIKSLESTK